MKKLIMLCLLSFFFLYGSAFGAFNFIDNGNGTVTDARTGLVWLKNANPNGGVNWYDAMAYCNSLASGTAGLTDGSVAGQWRLPSREELEGIGTDPPATWYSGGPPVTWTMPGAPFIDVKSYPNYWSSTTFASVPWGVWVFTMSNGDVVGSIYPQNSYLCVWPVRRPCDADYWKNLYEQTKAELDACKNPTTTTAPPTNIELSVLDATPSNEQVILQWKTETETGNAGFNVWRADNFVKINNAVIPALGSSVSGSDYNFVDEWVLNGKRYFYLLEDVDTDGISTFHGPVKATPRMIYGVGR